MAIFHCYVSSPEGNDNYWWHIQTMGFLSSKYWHLRTLKAFHCQALEEFHVALGELLSPARPSPPWHWNGWFHPQVIIQQQMDGFIIGMDGFKSSHHPTPRTIWRTRSWASASPASHTWCARAWRIHIAQQPIPPESFENFNVTRMGWSWRLEFHRSLGHFGTSWLQLLLSHFKDVQTADL